MYELKLYENIPFDNFPLQISYYTENRKCDFLPHWHEHIELHCIVKGNLSVQCEGKIIEAKTGDCLIIDSNELHEGAGGCSEHICINIPRSMVGPRDVKYKRVVSDSNINELALKIIHEHNHRDDSSNNAIMGYVYLLITILNRKYTCKKHTPEGYNIYSRKTVMLDKVINLLEDNYSEQLSLQEISEFAKVSKSYLCKEFRDYTGKTISEYINYLRCIKAKEFLISTDIPISEISYICGFSEPNYFTRKFRQIMGKTPRDIRKEISVQSQKKGNLS